jgi:hypothetical protein
VLVLLANVEQSFAKNKVFPTIKHVNDSGFSSNSTLAK